MIIRYINFIIPLIILFTACESIYKYDIVIRNGTIIDGTGNPRFHGDIAINGKYITLHIMTSRPAPTTHESLENKGVLIIY